MKASHLFVFFFLLVRLLNLDYEMVQVLNKVIVESKRTASHLHTVLSAE